MSESPYVYTPEQLNVYQDRLFGTLSGSSVDAIKVFCDKLPELDKAQYPDALVGMGYLYEAFDLMFALITASVQDTQDESPYVARYMTMQNVLQPFASEFGIEPDRPLVRPHRRLYGDFYAKVTDGGVWPSRYASVDSQSEWLACGRHWAKMMIDRLQNRDLSPMDRARYNLGYHWAVEALSVSEFDLLTLGWGSVSIAAPYLAAHCEVEEEHAGCAIGAVVTFSSVEDPLVIQGARDHEDDLAGFYQSCTELIKSNQLVGIG